MNKKNNNKGFSLVELIIVIAIMVVLVAVIAPQYLKFVNNSKISTDVQTASDMATAINVAVADGTYDASLVSSYAATPSKLGGTWTISSNDTEGVSQITLKVGSTAYECYPNPESNGTVKGIANDSTGGGLKK